MAELSVVGKNVTRIDALEKVTGAAKFTTEEGLGLPGMLYAKILHSPYPHAKIISIDTSKAAQLPGVRAVMTGKDVPAARTTGSLVLEDRHILCRNKVRFVGDAVAVVAADTEEAAEEALDLIQVEYEQLPALFDAEEAMKPDCAVVLHPDLPNYNRRMLPYLGLELPGSNVHTHCKVRRGNVDAGFQEAALIVENRFSLPRITHCQAEPYNAVAYPESDGSLTIYSAVHCIYVCLKPQISEIFGLPPSKVRVRSHYLGGSFGIEQGPERFVVLLALKTGKPVKVVYNRDECFTFGLSRLPAVIYIKDGVKSDGTLLAREIKVIFNTGAYAGWTPLTIHHSSFCTSQYRIPNLKWDSYGVYTNEPTAGIFRGFGNTQPLWAIEQQMDIIAEMLGIDPVELRKKNVIREGEENVRGEITESAGAEECLDKAAEWIEWGKPSEVPSGSFRRGKGLALGSKFSQINTASAAIVKVHYDGTVELRHSADEGGQGCNTVLAQIAAEEFDVPMEKVKVVWGDTAITPYDFGSVSSRTTFHTGNAIRLACQDAKRQIFDMAALKLGATPQDLEISDGKIYVRESPEKAIVIADIMALYAMGATCLPEGGEILGKATFIKHGTDEDPETGLGERMTAFYIYSAQAAEVEVDVETGSVKVLRFCSANDLGRAINPKLCEGQMEGGVGMGIGSALYEGLAIDEGAVLNPNYSDYKLPRMMEVPSGDNMGAIIVEAAQRDGPFGAKGVGEVALTPSAPAIANAIYNAIGIRIKDLPITPEKVLKALQQHKAVKEKGG